MRVIRISGADMPPGFASWSLRIRSEGTVITSASSHRMYLWHEHGERSDDDATMGSGGLLVTGKQKVVDELVSNPRDPGPSGHIIDARTATGQRELEIEALVPAPVA
jgi:hypothetical protein